VVIGYKSLQKKKIGANSTLYCLLTYWLYLKLPPVPSFINPCVTRQI